MTTTLDTAPASPKMLSEAALDVPTQEDAREEVRWAVENFSRIIREDSPEDREDTIKKITRIIYKNFLRDQIDGSILPTPNFGPIGQEVFERTYSRPIYKIDPITEELLRDEDGKLVLQDWWTWKRPVDGRIKENWADMCRRVSMGSLNLAKGHELPEEALDLFSAMYEFKVVPAGRHLWVTGTGSPFAKNCFAAETEVVTREGVRKIGDLVGQEVEVIDGNGGWTKTVAKSFGVQHLMRLDIKRGQAENKTIYATADHGWFAYNASAKKEGSKIKSLTTAELKPGQRLVTRVTKASVRPRENGESRTNLSPVGVQHGFVFGDGSRNDSTGSGMAYFAPEKDKDMEAWFPLNEIHEDSRGMRYCGNLPRYFKDVPPMNECGSYLLGFLAGYFAADGSVGNGATCTISSSNVANLELVRDICYRLGITVFGIRERIRQGYGDEPSSLFWITLNKNDLPEEFFLLSEHKKKWLKADKENGRREPNSWTVVSVEETDRVEEVFCFEVSTTHSFVLDGSILTSNCWVAPVGPRTSDHFKFTALRLFEGGGVGSNYSTDLWSAGQTVKGHIDLRITCSPRHADFQKVVDAAGYAFDTDGYGSVPYEEEDYGYERFMVDDSREGWAEVWTYLVDKSMEEGTHKILVDVSQVRKYGSPLKTFGGQASGPDPLVSACIAIVGVLNGAHGRRLNGLEAMEIDHQIAMSVVAGGTRRSARMSLMRWDDELIEEFLNCKIDSDKHWTTNISVEVDSDFKNALEDASHPKHELATHVLESIVLGMARDGEPGIVDTEQMSIGENTRIRMTNPCGETQLEFDPGDPENGIEGAGESCNLGSVNMDAFGTDTAGLIDAVRLTARVLYRATLNQHPNEAARRIEDKNRRIGVGFLGLQGWCVAHGAKLTDLASRTDLQHILIQMRLAARDAADELADELGTPRSVSVTAVAPTGTIAQLSGATPGMSPVMYKHFIRRVRFESNNPKLEKYAMQGYVIEDDVYAQNTSVVEFPVMDGMLAKYPDSAHLIEDSTEIAFEQFMDLVDVVQNTFCGGVDGQAVSSTAQLPAHADTGMIKNGIMKVLGKVKGVTAFPDESRPQQPYEHLTEEEYNETIGYIMDESSLVFDSNDGNCGTGGCPIV